MQADRACYVRRPADDQLVETIAAGIFAYVLAPRAMGKTSLMGRAIRRLRSDGQLAAVVDLAQIAPRSESVDSARWHYSIAYRVCRELRLKVDLQAWWQARNLLSSELRLVDFFWDVILSNTAVPVTIFLDEAERAIDLPFAHELFVAVHSCQMRRVSEPDFSRLNFVVLGAASREQLCPDPDVSPFTSGRRIELNDLTLDECMAFAPGLSQQQNVAAQTLANVFAWTHGQPYLTQKLARGVARKGAGVDVDSVAHDLFLAPNIAREEPLLSHMQALLGNNSPRSRHAAAMIMRLAKAQEVIEDPRSAPQGLLRIGGFVSSDDNGMLYFRNRIVERVFSRGVKRFDRRRQLRALPFVAAVLAALVLLPLWYLRILPATAIETLTAGRNAPAIVEAYAGLRRLPGFGGKADRLLGDAMVRLGNDAESIEQLHQIATTLADLPGGAERADALTAKFWLRRSRALASRGERDGALVHALEAAKEGADQAAELARNLIDGDYLKLERSVYLDAPPLAVAADWERNQLVIVDAGHRARQLALYDDPGPVGAGLQLTALQHVGVTRSLFVDQQGTADGLELTLSVEHDRPDDLLLHLRSPSGTEAEIELPYRADVSKPFVFRASAANGLAQFAGETIVGQWELTLFDRLSEQTGRLQSWGLRFSGASRVWSDEPVGGLPLPDPARTEQVDVILTGNGRFAVTLPTLADARGAASVWDLGLGARLTDLPLAERTEAIEWLTSDRLLIVGGHRATLWDPRSGVALKEFSSIAGFDLRPAVSPAGDYFALAETDGPASRIGLYRAADGSTVSQFSDDPWQDWVIGPQARFIAGIDGSRRGRVLNPATGELLAEFFHERSIAHLIPSGLPGRVLAADAAGDLFSWTLSAERVALRPADSRYIGSTRSFSTVSVAADTVALSFLDRQGLVAVSRETDGRRIAALQHVDSGEFRTQLSPGADRLLTVGDELIRVWSLGSVVEQSADFGDITAVAIDPTGQLAVLGNRGGAVRFLSGLPASITSGGASQAVIGHRAVVLSLAVNRNGTLAASGDSNGVIRIWNLDTGELDRHVLRHPAGPIGTMTFSPNDRWLLSAGLNLARVFDLSNGNIVSEIELEGTPLAVAFSADSVLIAVGDSAGNIVLATPEASAPARSIRRSAAVTALAFAELPSLLASGTATGELAFWDTSSVSMVGETQRFSGPINWLALSGDASAVNLQSGSWLHRLDRGGDSPVIVSSRLLPEPLRIEPALVQSAGVEVRALTHVGGGRLALADISLAPDAGIPAVETLLAQGVTTVPNRDWQFILGLILDTESGEILLEAP